MQDEREMALLSKWNKRLQDGETELKTQVAKLKSELEASKLAESSLQADNLVTKVCSPVMFACTISL